jgi:hypothetical protein
MKPSAQAFQRRNLENGDRALAESKCQACGKIVDTTSPSLERGETVAFPSPMEPINGEVPKKRPSSAVDLENLLHFSQQLYAHALTLQEVIRSGGEVTYEALKPRCERQAAEQFEIFYHPGTRPLGLRKRGAGSRG